MDCRLLLDGTGLDTAMRGVCLAAGDRTRWVGRELSGPRDEELIDMTRRLTGRSLRGRRRVVAQLSLGLLTVSQLVIGGWALLAPARFFNGFPAEGHAWVALLPPYNEHLVRDVGALSLALAVVLAVATVTADRRLIRVAAVAFAVYTVPHTFFHGSHLEGFTLGDGVAQMSGFVLQLLLAAAALGSTLERVGGPVRGQL